MKKIIAILCIPIFFLISGCASNQDVGKNDVSQVTAPEDIKNDVDWDGGLTMLRQAMVETPQVMAVAYLGIYEGGDFSQWLLENCKMLCDNHPIFTELDESMIVGDGNELYCVVAADENADITVNRINASDEVTEILKKTDGKKPMIIAANGADYKPDTEITLVDGEGRVAKFRPFTNDDGVLASNDAVIDFTSREEY